MLKLILILILINQIKCKTVNLPIQININIDLSNYNYVSKIKYCYIYSDFNTICFYDTSKIKARLPYINNETYITLYIQYGEKCEYIDVTGKTNDCGFNYFDLKTVIDLNLNQIKNETINTFINSPIFILYNNKTNYLKIFNKKIPKQTKFNFGYFMSRLLMIIGIFGIYMQIVDTIKWLIKHYKSVKNKIVTNNENDELTNLL